MGSVLDGVAGAGGLHVGDGPDYRQTNVAGSIADPNAVGRNSHPHGDTLTDTISVAVTLPTASKPASFTDNSKPTLELDLLVRAAQDERADALGEIIGQASEFITYFMDFLSITPSSHPATVRLMNVASLIALQACLYWKGYFLPVRPTQLLPGLMPPISIPGHASFPSGHATQSRLIALCVASVLPGYQPFPTGGTTAPTPTPGIGLAAPPPTTGSLGAAVQPGLDALTYRIARNREIAGLHYPSDRIGGQLLAANIFRYMLEPALLSRYQAITTAAKSEWP